MKADYGKALTLDDMPPKVVSVTLSRKNLETLLGRLNASRDGKLRMSDPGPTQYRTGDMRLDPPEPTLIVTAQENEDHYPDGATTPVRGGGTLDLDMIPVDGKIMRSSVPSLYGSPTPIFLTGIGQCISKTHAPDTCIGEHCTIHNQSDHHMRHMPNAWDVGVMWRVCEHLEWHPDPDEITQVQPCKCQCRCCDAEARDAG